MSATQTLYAPGIHDGMSNLAYHSAPGLSSTGMKILASKTPAHYRHQMDNTIHADHFDIGTAAHSLVLEGDESQVKVLDFDDWRTKAAKEARDEAYADGLTPLLAKDWAMVKAIRDQVAAHPIARLALDGGVAERSAFTTHAATGTLIRARADKHRIDSPIGPIIVDLKNLVSADPREFGKTAANYGYHQQDANYRDVFKAVSGEDHTFLFVLVEKTAPYLVSVVELCGEAVDLGRRLNEKAIRIYAECQAKDEWPGYPTTDPIALPVWAALNMEDSLK